MIIVVFSAMLSLVAVSCSGVALCLIVICVGVAYTAYVGLYGVIMLT